jgi:hypothetical protein
MKLKNFTYKTITYSEIENKNQLLGTLDDFMDILGNSFYSGAEAVIIYQSNLTNEFFNLRTRFAGEVLQKFSNYQSKLAIVGDFSGYDSKALRDFIRESNRMGRILFVPSKENALELWE